MSGKCIVPVFTSEPHSSYLSQMEKNGEMTEKKKKNQSVSKNAGADRLSGFQIKDKG